MIQVLYGEDVVEIDEALAELMNSAGPADLRDINCISLRAEDVSPEKISAAAFTVPFMADRRTVVVRGLLARFERGRPRSGAATAGGSGRDPLGAWSGFVDQLSSMPPSTHLAFVDGGLSRDNALLRRLAPLSDVSEFRMPRDREMPGWIVDRARTIGVRIDPGACAVLADALGRQPRLIDSELRKLALFADSRPVSVDDVRRMVAYVREANIFQAVDAIIDGKTGLALRMLGRIMDDGNPAAYVMTMISRQVRLLLMANDLMAQGLAQDEIGRRIRLSGWVLNKTLQQTRRTSSQNLRYMHSRLVETDLLLKTKPIEEQLALEILIGDLTSRLN